MKVLANIRVLLFIVAGLTPQLLVGQANSLFEEFLQLFPGEEINAEMLQNVLKIEGEFDQNRLAYEKRIAGRIIQKTESYYLLSVRFSCPAGGYCESTDWYSFDLKGNLISQVQYAKRFGDCAFVSSVSPVYFNNEVLQLIYSEIEYSCDMDTTYSHQLKSKIYKIREDGTIKLNSEQSIDARRKYHLTSSKKLQESYLAKTSKEDLAAMRNELFASYGYRFKSTKWQSYFTKQEWYQGFRDKVPESDLSPVEFENLKLIQRFEKKLD